MQLLFFFFGSFYKNNIRSTFDGCSLIYTYLYVHFNATIQGFMIINIVFGYVSCWVKCGTKFASDMYYSFFFLFKYFGEFP